MPPKRIDPVSLPSGRFAASWFDDERSLWSDDRLEKEGPLVGAWEAPRLQLAKVGARPTDVLFNPDALAVSERVRVALAHLVELEFLPVTIAGAGTWYVLHPLMAIEPPQGCAMRIADMPSGNMVQFFGFPRGFEPQPNVFRLRHPPGSAARRGGYCFRAIFASERGAAAIGRTCAGFLEAVEVIAPG